MKDAVNHVRSIMKPGSISPAREKLLTRLANTGHLLVTPITADEFDQMSVADCRRYVRGVEEELGRIGKGGR